MNAFKKSIAKGRAALLPLLLSVPLLACATDGVPKDTRTVYVYPPASLLVVGDDPTKPTLEQLAGPDGDKYAAKYILDLELSGMTRAQSLRCLQEWVNIQKAREAGNEPSSPPPVYCVFEEK